MVRFATLSRYAALLCFVASLLVLPGCGGGGGGAAAKVSENWNKVTSGQSEKQVTDLLGAPKDKSEIDPSALMKGMPGIPAGMPGMGKMTVLYWEEGDKGYVVQLLGDKVTLNVTGSKAEMEKKKKGEK
jgi:hypothetical protein